MKYAGGETQQKDGIYTRYQKDLKQNGPSNNFKDCFRFPLFCIPRWAAALFFFFFRHKWDQWSCLRNSTQTLPLQRAAVYRRVSGPSSRAAETISKGSGGTGTLIRH